MVDLPIFQGSTITRTVISKNGEERRDAFRATGQRKSSIEKLEDIKVNRSSKLGFTIKKSSLPASSNSILRYGPYRMDQTYGSAMIKPLAGTFISTFGNEKNKLIYEYEQRCC